MSDEPNWEGSPGTLHEHRTVGPHRAWCYADSAWCYPDDLCQGCDQVRLPEYLRGLNVGDAIADERERIAQAIETARDNYIVSLPGTNNLIDGRSSGAVFYNDSARIARNGGSDGRP